MASHFLEQQQQQKRLSRVVTQECHKICVPFLTSGLMLLQILRAQTIATTTTTKDREKKPTTQDYTVTFFLSHLM